jgi:acyl-CoA dehydrogenase
MNLFGFSMLLLIECIILFLIACALIYINVSTFTWTLLFGLMLGLFSFLHTGTFYYFIWGIFTPIALMFNISYFRKLCFSRAFLRYFCNVLPTMSSTERTALKAGDVWWEGDLFSGRPNWNKLLAIPKSTLTIEERDFIDNETETLCKMLDDWKIVQEDCDLTSETWKFIKEKGFFALAIEKKYGGKGFSAYGHSTIVSKIAARSISAAVNIMVPNSLGPAELLSHYGTEKQKKHYLPKLATGEEVPCFALTSTQAGSDAGAMEDVGIICKGEFQGETIVGIKLTWKKRYITLAPIATVLGLAFKLYDPEHLLGDTTNIGITVCLLPTSHPGVNVGKRHYPMNLAFMNGPTEGKDVFIPIDWIIGGTAMAGKGWQMLMECLSIGRSISLPALSAGVARLSYHTTSMYTQLRSQFKRPISQFEGIQKELAYIAANTYLLEASRSMTAGAVDLKVKPSTVSAIQKYHSTEISRCLYNKSLDIHAGHAIQLGPSNYLGQIYYGIPMMITVEGANILTRNLIIFGQGAIRCHPYILKEMAAANDNNEKRALQQFDKVLKSHIGYSISNAMRAICFGLSNARFVKTPKKTPFSYYYRQLTRMSNALALTSDFAMLILGGELKLRENLSSRLGDILSHLYLASTVLKYHNDESHDADDTPFVEWCLQSSLYSIQNSFQSFFDNFPSKLTAKSLKRAIFPFGYCYKAPSDKLDSKLVKSMLQSNSTRKRLTNYLYSPDDINDCVGRLNIAFKASKELEIIDKKITTAIKKQRIHRTSNLEEQLTLAEKNGIIDENEVKRYVEVKALVLNAMEVDEFEHDELSRRMS